MKTSSNLESKVYIEAKKQLDLEGLFYFASFPFYIVFGSVEELVDVINTNKNEISKSHLEVETRNKLLDYFDLSKTKARIEKGAIIRNDVQIDDTSIILMGAIINTQASIGKNTMIDMNAVVGSGAVIKDNCHIGAGAVIAGMMEPISTIPVIIEDNVLIGANATILNGVKIGKNSIVGAGSVVTCDVEENVTVAGVPAKVINKNGKWEFNKDLR